MPVGCVMAAVLQAMPPSYFLFRVDFCLLPPPFTAITVTTETQIGELWCQQKEGSTRCWNSRLEPTVRVGTESCQELPCLFWYVPVFQDSLCVSSLILCPVVPRLGTGNWNHSNVIKTLSSATDAVWAFPELILSPSSLDVHPRRRATAWCAAV